MGPFRSGQRSVLTACKLHLLVAISGLKPERGQAGTETAHSCKATSTVHSLWLHKVLVESGRAQNSPDNYVRCQKARAWLGWVSLPFLKPSSLPFSCWALQSNYSLSAEPQMIPEFSLSWSKLLSDAAYFASELKGDSLQVVIRPSNATFFVPHQTNLQLQTRTYRGAYL